MLFVCGEAWSGKWWRGFSTFIERILDGWDENVSRKSWVKITKNVCALPTSCFVAFRCSHFHPFRFACVACGWLIDRIFPVSSSLNEVERSATLQFRLECYAGGWEATCFDVSLDSQHCEPNELSPVPAVFDRCSGRAPSASRRENFAPKRTRRETARRIQKVQTGQNGGQNGCEFWRIRFHMFHSLKLPLEAHSATKHGMHFVCVGQRKACQLLPSI